MYLKVVKKTSILEKNRNFKKKMKNKVWLKPYFLTLTVPFTVSFK